MRRTLFAFVLALHGLVHLMGTVDFWGITDLDEISPPVGADAVVWLLGGLWLVAAAGFLLGAVALVQEQPWWRPLVLATAVLSFLLAGSVWSDAWVGMVLSALIAFAALPGRFIPSPDDTREPVEDGPVARRHITEQRPVTRRIAPRG